MITADSTTHAGGLSKAAAWVAHLYTATGAILAFLSLRAAISGDIRAAFLWLAFATIVDSTDGLLARFAHVKVHVPDVDGSRLDDIVDYLTFVFVPALILDEAGSLPSGWGVLVLFAILLSSVIAFAKSDAKTDDHFFTGFPSYWNIVALYLVAAGTAPALNAVILLGLCALVFVRIGYIYPSRTPTLQALTNVLGCAWGAIVLYLIWQLPHVSGLLLALSLFYPVYYIVLSLVLNARRD